MGVFQIKMNPSGLFYFVFLEGDQFCIVSKSYVERSLLEDSIVQLRKFSDISEIIVDDTSLSYPCFLIKEDSFCHYTFHVYGVKGGLIMTSMPFQTMKACQEAIVALKMTSKISKIIDLT